jgi:predicted Zn-dependent protease
MCVAFLLLAACAVNPATGRREISLVSESREIQMGRDADPEITASLGMVDDPELQAYVTRLGDMLAATSERPALPWSFKVVDDPLVNAFALPGGFIYVTRGILAHFDSEAELVGVLGHEIGHVTARHSANQISRQQLQQIGLGVGSILSENVRSASGVLGAGLQMLNLSYSRGNESQSDELGLRYMGRAGYDGSALIGVFRMLAEASGGSSGRLPEWQLTHPYPENREADIRGLLAASGASGGTVGRDAFLERLDGLIYGENPRDGFFRGGSFLHPDLEFRIDFPAGWEGSNQRTVVMAMSPEEDALMTLSIEADEVDAFLALRTFLAGEGISGGRVSEKEDGGVTRARAPFTASTSEGNLRGEVAFAELDGRVYRLLGYAGTRAWPGHGPAVGRAIESFSRLDDPEVLAVQPWRLEIVTVPDAMSLRDFAARYAGPVSLDELGRLNRMAPDAVAPAGSRLKRVVGSPLR